MSTIFAHEMRVRPVRDVVRRAIRAKDAIGEEELLSRLVARGSLEVDARAAVNEASRAVCRLEIRRACRE